MTHPCRTLVDMELHRTTAARDLTEDANNNGFRASTYWALARGLAADITDAAWTDPEVPIRTPGLDGLLRGVGKAVHDCHTAVDDAFLLGDDDLPDSETLLALEMAVIRTAQAHQQSAVITRRIAQLGLGVCEYLDPDAYATDRLRQACTAVLYMYPFEPFTIVDDGLAIASRDATDLYCELSGLLARMMLEGDTRFHIYVDSVYDPGQCGQRRFRVSTDDGAVHISTNHGHDSTWPHPASTFEPVRFIIETMLDHLGHEGDTLEGVRFSLI